MSAAASPPAPATRPCRYCKMPIALVRNARGGATLPLQRVRTVYSLRADGAYKLAIRHTWVSHFETCPHAEEARRDAQKARQATDPK